MRPYGWQGGRWKGEKKGLEEERPGSGQNARDLQKAARHMPAARREAKGL